MDFRPGDKFGDRYQLISKLGEGGMGEVWKEIRALTGSKGADIHSAHRFTPPAISCRYLAIEIVDGPMNEDAMANIFQDAL